MAGRNAVGPRPDRLTWPWLLAQRRRCLLVDGSPYSSPIMSPQKKCTRGGATLNAQTTWDVSELVDALKPDPWREANPFSNDMDECHQFSSARICRLNRRRRQSDSTVAAATAPPLPTARPGASG